MYLVNLRILGILFALVFVALAFLYFRRNRLSTPLFFLFEIVGLGLIIVAVYPPSVDILVSMLSMQEQQFARLIALLVLTSLFLLAGFFFLYRRLSDQQYTTACIATALARNTFLRIYPDFKTTPIMCLIPAYNEADNIGHVLKAMPKEILGLQVGVLVVDDCSGDKTAEVAEAEGAYVARLPIRQGGGVALRTGFEIVLQYNGCLVVTLDGDGQHNPAEIETLLSKLVSNEADIVIGSRVLGAQHGGDALRALGVKVFSRMISFLTATKITDCSSGFRAFNSETLKTFMLRQQQYHTSELIIESIKRNARIAEVPIVISRRLYGGSKKGRNFIYGANFALVILKTWLRNPRKKI